MATTTAGQVLMAMVAAFRTGRVSDVEGMIAAEYLDHQGLNGRPLHGPTGFATVVAMARSVYDELEVTIEDLLEQGDRAAARLRWRATRASGEVVERVTLEMIRTCDGVAVEHWGGRS